jgi:vacuolar protein sorting-associated protein 16
VIRSITNQLDDAIDMCIDAATYEFSPATQKLLLRAAVFGKAFSQTASSSTKVHQTGKILRILNSVRESKVGIPISFRQYHQLGTERLVNRLLSQHEHLLALKISEYLNLSKQPVISHWATEKMRHSLDTDDMLCQQIVSKLDIAETGSIDDLSNQISFAGIAKIAYAVGRPVLSAQLLEFERRPAEQIPLLLSMGQHAQALEKALQSHDADVVYNVLFQLKSKLSMVDFFRVISENKESMQIYETHLNQLEDWSTFRDFIYQDDRRYDLAKMEITDAFREDQLASRVEKLKAALKSLAELKDHSFEARAIDEQLRLLNAQDKLEASLKKRFVGLSLTQTLYDLVYSGELSKSQKLKSDFKVPDKRYWYVCVRALSEKEDWDGLDKLGKSRKSPIGYQFFAEQCARKNQMLEASKFLFVDIVSLLVRKVCLKV